MASHPRPLDPIALSQELIRCPSVTPSSDSCIALMDRVLTGLGLHCQQIASQLPVNQASAENMSALDSADEPPGVIVANLYAEIGEGRPRLVFQGHVDTVPTGDLASWSQDPYTGEIVDGVLYGRGASDMKAAIAAFTSALSTFLWQRGADFGGTIGLALTGDEEGDGSGMRAVLTQMEQQQLVPDAMLAGEPSNLDTMGQVVKNGRRGSINYSLQVNGVQGHVAYPERATNATLALNYLLQSLPTVLDDGYREFPPSRLSLTGISGGYIAENLVPGLAQARFNIRFNPLHQADDLTAMLQTKLEQALQNYQTAFAGLERVGEARFTLTSKLSGVPFMSPGNRLPELIAEVAMQASGRRPTIDTLGGTSDLRFLPAVFPDCDLAEYGLPGRTMHQADESVRLADIQELAATYLLLLQTYFPVR